jgi:hypothetical protein
MSNVRFHILTVVLALLAAPYVAIISFLVF